MPIDWLDQIRADNTSGAGCSAAELETTADALVQAQPRMAPLFNLASAVLVAGPEGVEAACREFIRRLQSAGESISSIGAGLIRGSATAWRRNWPRPACQSGSSHRRD